jgi:uncharacterized protein YgbK (DUF1537 family)
MHARYLIIADDLSGAADCAAGFADAGLSTDVLLDVSAVAPGHAQVLTLDTDSRRDGAAQSTAKLEAALAMHGQGRTVVKKIDSTLRGGWAHEVAVLQKTLGIALVAPSFPAMGRIMRDGLVEVHGRRLAQTDTWQLEHAGQDDRPAHMLRQAGLTVENAPVSVLESGAQAAADYIARAAARGVQAIVFDATRDSHLDTLAEAGQHLSNAFNVCSAGLSHALARLATGHAAPLPTRYALPDTARQASSVITLVGSMSAMAKRQLQYLAGQPRVRVHQIAPALLRGRAQTAQDAQATAALPKQLQEDMAQGLDVAVAIADDAQTDPAEGPQLAMQLAALLREPLGQAAGLVVTGGETARAVLKALGIHMLHVHAQSEPGVVISVSEAPRPQWIATKAGAFGQASSLHQASQAIRALLSGGPMYSTKES